MSCYNINIYDMYIKKEYRAFITEVFQNKDWRLFPDDRIHEHCEDLDERDIALLFADSGESGWQSKWDEQTGRLQLNKEYNIRTYYDAYSYLDIYFSILPEYCEEDKMCFHAFWGEENDNCESTVFDLKSGRRATLGYILTELCDDHADYEKLTDRWEEYSSAQNEPAKDVFLLEYGALSRCTNEELRQLTDHPREKQKLLTLDELIAEDGTFDIPEYIREIKPYTFKGCERLKRVEFNGRALFLHDHAFALCPALEEVIFAHHPNSSYMSEFHSTINGAAFSGCTALKRVQLPRWMQRIQPYTFFGCISLEEVALPAGRQERAEFAQEKGIPDGIKDQFQREAICTGFFLIDSHGFSLCRKLSEISLPDGFTYLGKGAFFGCSSLREVRLPSTLETIKAEAFRRCASLKRVDIPEHVHSLGSGAFNDCTALTEVSITRRTEVFGEEAHSVIEALSHAIFHTTSIGKGKFGWYAEHYAPLEGLTIFCPENSAAEFYARYNGIRFQLTESAQLPS